MQTRLASLKNKRRSSQAGPTNHSHHRNPNPSPNPTLDAGLEAGAGGLEFVTEEDGASEVIFKGVNVPQARGFDRPLSPSQAKRPEPKITEQELQVNQKVKPEIGEQKLGTRVFVEQTGCDGDCFGDLV